MFWFMLFSGVNFHCDPQSRNKILIETIPACIMEKDVNYVKSTRENVAWNIVKVANIVGEIDRK